MSPSPAHLFDLRTITISEAPPTRVSAFCYKGLAAFRMDAFVSHLEDQELWTITILRDDALFPMVPVFKNIDDVTGFIFDISILLNWEQPLTTQKLQSISKPLSQIFAHHKAYLLEFLLKKLIPESAHDSLSIPIPSETST